MPWEVIVRGRRILAGSAAVIAVLVGLVTNAVTSMYPVPAGWRGWLTAALVLLLVLAVALAVISVGGSTDEASAPKPLQRRTERKIATQRGAMGVAATASVGLLGVVCSCSVTGIFGPPSGPIPPRIGDCDIPNAPLALAVGGHANNASPRVTPEVGDVILYAIQAEKPIMLIGIDGNPSVSAVIAPQAPGRIASIRNLEQRKLASQIQESVTSLRVEQPETDPLVALQIAARSVGGSGTIVMFDSGLQTVAPLDMTVPRFFDKPVAQIVRDLGTSVPSLSTLTVIFAGLGDVAAPQPSLGQARREHLQQLWRAILQGAGARCMAFLPQPAAEGTVGSSTPARSRPSVRIVTT